MHKIYKTVILPAVSYRCETLSHTLRKGHRLRVSGYRVLRGMFGPKREEIAGGWRRLHSLVLHKVYASANTIQVIKSKRMRWVIYVAYMGDMINEYNILIGKPEGKRRPHERPRYRWKIILEFISEV
jgi:hypothetical protein